MKKFLLCLLLPLLFSFSTPDKSTQVSVQQQGKQDSLSTVNITFNPSSVIVEDTRNLSTIERLVTESTETSKSIAQSFNATAEFVMNEIQKGRCDFTKEYINSIVQVNLPKDYTHLIQKKRIFDQVFYTIFLVGMLFFLIPLINMLRKPFLFKDVGFQKFIANITLLGSVWIIYMILDRLVNYEYHTFINTITKLVPG